MKVGFNPRPARGPDAAQYIAAGIARYIDVSILAQPEGRTQPNRATRSNRDDHVSILAQPEGRTQPIPPEERIPDFEVVSILAQPEGRTQQRITAAGATHTRSFNPRPARGPDAASRAQIRPSWDSTVSILAQPEGRTQRAGAARSGPGGDVSILAQPEGRTQHDLQLLIGGQDAVSILAQPEGRTQPESERVLGFLVVVSILAQPEGRTQPRLRMKYLNQPLFQSSPSPRAGRSIQAKITNPQRDAEFQSSPSPRAGRSPCASPTATPTGCFNPRPARGPDAAQFGIADVFGDTSVSILAQPEGRTQPPRVVHCIAHTVVSILAQPEGRTQPRCRP